MRWWRPCLLLLVLLPAVEWAQAEAPNIILITLDTTRADRMGFLGSKRGLTPNLDALARQAVVFERAYSQAPLTTVSHATIFTGTYPQFHGVNDFGVPLPKEIPALAELLKARGYRTAAFVGSLILDPAGGLAPGFDRGFELYDAGFRIRHGREDRYQTMERRAAEVVRRAVAWLRGVRGRFFLWVHLYDPHDPYDPPTPYSRRFFAGRLYDGEIASTDAAVGTLLAALRARGLFDGALIAVLADHGEALGDHGELTHGVFLYEETIRVPLVVKLPRRRHAGHRATTRVSLVDIAPTVLEAVGAAPLPTMQGQSLLALLGLPGPEDRPSYAETDYPRRAFGWSPLASLRTDKYLFVEAPRREHYDLKADPASQHNLAESSPAVSETLANQLEALRRRYAGSSRPSAQLGPEQEEKLAALGYVADRDPSSTPDETRADPKDKITIANALHEAIVHVESGRYAEAVSLLERALSGDANLFVAQMQLGLAWVRQREFARALPPLRKAVELLPDSGKGNYELGLALFETGDWQASATHFEAAVRRLPKWADAHFSLAAVYARTDRVPEAIAHLRAALDLAPRHFRANLLMGRILTLQDLAAEGVSYLETAVQAQPSSSEAHTFLADAYQRLGSTEDERREREAARKAKGKEERP
ncbi:MAG: sulfatase-like hydrolase/transferase [Terriglobales bacterium]